MPLLKRILKVTFKMPSGDEVVLDQDVDLRIRIHKGALEPQNTATIEVANLTQNLRLELMSQFTAYNKRAVQKNQPLYGGATNPYVNVVIEAGYDDGKTKTSAVIFQGQVVEASLSSPPPNMSMRIDCFTQQLNKLTWRTQPTPPGMTFKEYVMWAGKQMETSNTICETSRDDVKMGANMSGTTYIVGALLIDLQNAYQPDVVAYIDDNVLIVRDYGRVVSVAGKVDVDTFIGAPTWTQWGVSFRTMFDQTITMTCAVTLKSEMNPSLNHEFVVVTLDYDLASRTTPFYCTVYACPPSA